MAMADDPFKDGALESVDLKKPHSDIDVSGDEEVNDNPIEQVRLTVPITDDPKQPALTFRTWVLGLLTCSILAFVNQFFGYRQNQLYIGSVSAQILVLPIGRLMAATLPDRKFRVPFTNWSFTMNPGPFTLKEHVLITIFAGSGSNSVYAVGIVNIVKAFYHRQLNPYAGYLLSMTTQVPAYTHLFSFFPHQILI
ncbi:oligopeptide transporter [Sarracenia purpurea var. burkii]